MKAQPTKLFLAMALCLTVVACGAKKSDNSSPQKPEDATKPTIPVEAPPPSPLPENRNRTDAGPSTTPSPGKDPIPVTVTETGTGTDSKSDKQKQADKQKQKENEQNQIGIEKQDNSGSTIVFDGTASEQEVANMVAESKRYSGSASDGLREFLNAQMEQVGDASARIRNMKFASSIITAQLRPINGGKRMQMKIKLLQLGQEKESQRERTLTFSGISTLQKNSKRLDLISVSEEKDKKGKPVIRKDQRATLTCLDANQPKMQNCQTIVAQVGLNQAMVQIIFRQATVYTRADFDTRRCLTPECDDVFALFLNTQTGQTGLNSLKSATMETAEIIQGKSIFNIMLVARSGEALKFAGPLNNPELYPTTNTPVDQKLNVDERTDRDIKGYLKSNISNSFRDVRMLRNDGNASLLIKVWMKVMEDGDRDIFTLSFSRDVAPIRDYLEDKSLDWTVPTK